MVDKQAASQENVALRDRVDEVEARAQKAQPDPKSASTPTDDAVLVTFEPLFSTKRIAPEGVQVLLRQDELMQRAIFDFAARFSTYYNLLRFSLGPTEISIVDKVSKVGSTFEVLC